MKLSKMKTRIAAFGLAMLMAVSPLGSAAYVSAAETTEIPEKTTADGKSVTSRVEAKDITRSVKDDAFMPETCMQEDCR